MPILFYNFLSTQNMADNEVNIHVVNCLRHILMLRNITKKKEEKAYGSYLQHASDIRMFLHLVYWRRSQRIGKTNQKSSFA